MIDLIVPTVTGREASLERCVDSFERLTESLNVIVIRDEPTCGAAWIEGMKLSTAPYLALSCDDLELVGPDWASICTATVDSGRLPCPVVRRPNGSLESSGGDMTAPACLISELQADETEVDFTVSPFMSREQADAIGMLDVHYGSDVWVSWRGRQLGWPTVVRHGFSLIHHHHDVGRKAWDGRELDQVRRALA